MIILLCFIYTLSNPDYYSLREWVIDVGGFSKGLFFRQHKATLGKYWDGTPLRRLMVTFAETGSPKVHPDYFSKLMVNVWPARVVDAQIPSPQSDSKNFPNQQTNSVW